MQDHIVKEERKIGIPGYKNVLPYYTNTSWDEEKYGFYFFSFKHGSLAPAVYFYHVDTDTSEKLFDLTLLKNEKDIGYLSLSVFLPKRNLLFFIADNSIAVADLKTGKQAIKVPIDAARNHHGTTITADERLLCFGTSGEGSVQTEVQIFDTSLPEWKEVKNIPLAINASHFQFFSNGENILFAHEGDTTKIPDRLNLLNWKSGEIRCLHRHIHDANGNQIECIGHEHIAGDKVLAVRYPDSQMDFGIIVVDPETGDFELVDRGDYWHSASNQNGTKFVMDTMWWANSRRKIPGLVDVILFDAEKKKRHILKTFTVGPLTSQLYHVHPHMNRTGSMVLYTVRPTDAEECHLELLRLK